MIEVFSHIVGLNDELKEFFVENVTSLKFNIIDLDKITESILNDKGMNEIYDELDKNPKKSKETERKMCNYWRDNFYSKLSKLVENNKCKIILLGKSSFFKNNRINIKIETNLKFFVKVNLLKNAKNIVENNLDNHRKEIINGSFPLDYLNIDFLIKKREDLLNIYTKLGYEEKMINNIVKIIKNNYDNYIESDLYVGSVDKYNKLIKNKTIHAFTAPWLAVLSSINSKYLKGGFKKGEAFIRESKDGEIKNLNRECYLYKIDKKNFYKSQDGMGMKFISNKNVKIEDNYYIENILNYLKDNNVRIN
jgi:hypothetical protein